MVDINRFVVLEETTEEEPEELFRTMEEIYLTGAHIEPLLPPYFFRKAVTFVVGGPGFGKTTFTYAMAKEVGMADPFLGLQPPQHLMIVVLDFESSDGELNRIRDEMGEFPDSVRVFNKNGYLLQDVVREGHLAAEYAKQPFDLLIIDNLGMAYKIRDENDNAEAMKLIKGLKDLADEYNCAVLLYHHPSKNPEAKGSIMGSGAFTWARYCSVHVNILVADEQNDILEFAIPKNRESQDKKSRFCRKMGRGFFEEVPCPADYRVASTKSEADYPVNKVMAFLRRMPTGTYRRQELVDAVVKALKVSVPTADRGLADTVRTGGISKGDYGRYVVA